MGFTINGPCFIKMPHLLKSHYPLSKYFTEHGRAIFYYFRFMITLCMLLFVCKSNKIILEALLHITQVSASWPKPYLFQTTPLSIHHMDYCIVYISSSKGLLSDEKLNRILERSRKNNRASGITGVLLYFNGCIIQVLEGPEERVKALYEVIRRDTQHTQVIKMYGDFIMQRSFSDWLMGYKTMSARELDHLEHKLSFINDSFDPVSKEKASNPVLSILQVFYENNQRT